MKNYKIFLILILFSFNALADVLKPALIEASIFKDRIELKFFINLEALISGINTNLKNTKDAKNEDKYQELRKLSKEKLELKFLKYQTIFLNNINFSINQKKTHLKLKSINIADIGYIKRSRKSSITYVINNNNSINTISWQYFKNYGDSAFRWRFYKKDEYSWNVWQIINQKLTINVAQFKPLNFMENLIKFTSTGFKHVIPMGFDHILFIIAMSLSVFNLWKIIILVSSFTLAHTITLALSMIDVITISSSIIEPLIALSIILLVIENLFFKYQQRRQVIAVFIFGLLHGLGFALMLKEFIGKDLISSLVGFNIGVELAQIVIVLGVLLVLFFIKQIKLKISLITIPVNLIIGIIAIFMFFNRIL